MSWYIKIVFCSGWLFFFYSYLFWQLYIYLIIVCCDCKIMCLQVFLIYRKGLFVCVGLYVCSYFSLGCVCVCSDWAQIHLFKFVSVWGTSEGKWMIFRLYFIPSFRLSRLCEFMIVVQRSKLFVWRKDTVTWACAVMLRSEASWGDSHCVCLCF